MSRTIRRLHPWSLIAALAAGAVQASPEALLADYAKAGAGPFDPAAGASAWVQEHSPPKADAPRSCALCHGQDLTRPGRHITTGKTIEPMAPSVNPERLSDPVKTERWLGRNCRWTLGRDCTAQEKGDLLRFIASQ